VVVVERTDALVAAALTVVVANVVEVRVERYVVGQIEVVSVSTNVTTRTLRAGQSVTVAGH
jgi:hypothetical protein